MPEDLAKAVSFVKGHSQYQASQIYGIPRSTLSYHIRCPYGQPDPEEPRVGSHMTPRQEERVCQWILRQESIGYAPTYRQIRGAVTSLLMAEGREVVLGQHWAQRFVHRHPQIKAKIGRRQEAIRFDGFTPKAVNWYFNIRDGQYHWIRPENTVNVDEGGVLMGMGKFGNTLMTHRRIMLTSFRS